MLQQSSDPTASSRRVTLKREQKYSQTFRELQRPSDRARAKPRLYEEYLTEAEQDPKANNRSQRRYFQIKQLKLN